MLYVSPALRSFPGKREKYEQGVEGKTRFLLRPGENPGAVVEGC